MKNNVKTTMKQRKDKVVTFRLPMDDLIICKDLLSSQNIKLSSWLRDQVRNKIEPQPVFNQN